MRVAMLQSSLPPSSRAGGVGYQVHLLATAMARSGDDVTVFVADDPPSGTLYRCVGVGLGTGRGRRVLGVGWRFAQLDLSGFDVVHAHGDDWLFGRRKRVRTFYGSALMEARTATSALRKVAQMSYYALEWASSVNPANVSISENTRRYLPLIRSSVPCGYDPKIFFPGGERTQEPSILFVAGTLAGRKRGDLLLTAFQDVRRALPTAQLTIVSHDRVTQPGVNCLSNLGAGPLGDLYRSHWLLCSTSSYEGFGVPYVEALASGLPIVSTRNDGAEEVLQGGELGVLCAPEALASEIVTLLRDRNSRDRFTAVGLRAAEQYSIDVVADKYRTMYQRLANSLSSGASEELDGSPPERASNQPSTSQGKGATA